MTEKKEQWMQSDSQPVAATNVKIEKVGSLFYLTFGWDTLMAGVGNLHGTTVIYPTTKFLVSKDLLEKISYRIDDSIEWSEDKKES